MVLKRAGYKVYTGVTNYKEVNFVALKDDNVLYVQATYLLVDENTINRKYSPLEQIADNYEKVVVSLDDVAFPLEQYKRGISDLKNTCIQNIMTNRKKPQQFYVLGFFSHRRCRLNIIMAIGGLTCKLGVLCFYSSPVLIDSFVLRNPPLAKP
ncbi:MAG: hypothetical protein M9887_12525 [Chitinophagales bacterium]|nr:hypothetical protein [Chitinophagales bacterium]